MKNTNNLDNMTKEELIEIINQLKEITKMQQDLLKSLTKLITNE